MRKDGASQAEFGMTMPSRGRADWKKSTPMKEKRMEQRSLVWRTLPSFDGNGAGLPHSTWSPGAIHLQCAPDSTHHKPYFTATLYWMFLGRPKKKSILGSIRVFP
jgi:hypothetical protein